VTIARALTDTFSGIRPGDAPAFVIAQCVGAVLAAAALGWLLHPKGYPQAGAGRQKKAAAPE
jgi:glycerol uptake facilitator-like aquaporin